MYVIDEFKEFEFSTKAVLSKNFKYAIKTKIKMVIITTSRILFLFIFLAAGLGIEPKFSLSESDVLPLDDPAILHSTHTNYLKNTYYSSWQWFEKVYHMS